MGEVFLSIEMNHCGLKYLSYLTLFMLFLFVILLFIQFISSPFLPLRRKREGCLDMKEKIYNASISCLRAKLRESHSMFAWITQHRAAMGCTFSIPHFSTNIRIRLNQQMTAKTTTKKYLEIK